MIGRPLVRLEAVTSTQDVAFRLAELGAPEGTTVLARYQSGGRGRGGRSWTTHPGDALLFSVLLRPTVAPFQLSPLSILIADAIAESLRTLHNLSPAIKWPNDVLLDGGKVSGILIQARGPVAVAGVGVNLAGDSRTLPPGATSVREQTRSDPDAERLLWSILAGIDRRYRAVVSGEAAALVSGIGEVLWLRGSPVTIDDGGRMVAGTLRGLRDDGALILDTWDGTRAIISGELVRGPRAVLP